MYNFQNFSETLNFPKNCKTLKKVKFQLKKKTNSVKNSNSPKTFFLKTC